MTAVQTRLATVEDIPAIAGLFDAYRQFYGQPPDLALASRFIADRLSRNDSTILVAESEANPAGFCQLYPSFCSVIAAPIAILYDLFVGADFRKLGTGKALLTAAEQFARRNGLARLDLSTARTNLAAQSLYESMGWRREEAFFVYSKSLG